MTSARKNDRRPARKVEAIRGLYSGKSSSKSRTPEAIRLYRRHAARALAEERWSAAEIFLDRILEIDPQHTETWLMKGHIRHHCREDLDTAVMCFRKVITLCGYDSSHPHVQRARRSMGRLLSSWG